MSWVCMSICLMLSLGRLDVAPIITGAGWSLSVEGQYKPGTGPNTLGWCQLTPLPFASAATFHQHEPPTDSWEKQTDLVAPFLSSKPQLQLGLPRLMKREKKRKEKERRKWKLETKLVGLTLPKSLYMSH